MWAQAPAVPFTGTGSTAGSSILRALWKEGRTDRICYFLKHTHPDLTAMTTSEDDTAIFSDTALDVRTRYVDLLRVRDQYTYTFVANGVTPTPTIYDRNDAGGTSNPSFNFENRSAAATYAAGVLIIEACHDVPTNVSAGQQFLADVGVNEKQSGLALRHRLAHCTGTNLTDPACWGVWTLASTVIERPPDTTAPQVGTPNCTPHESGAVCVSAISETDSLPVSCRAFRDADQDNEVTADSEYVTSSCGTMLGGQCTCSYTGLTLPDHEVQIEATDAAGNAGVSAMARFSLTASSGDTFYIAIARAGDNSNACTTPGKPCADLAGILAKPNFGPGDTIRVLNGTHTTGFALNCGDNPSKFNGTPALRITLRAENERQAHIIPTNALNVPLSFQNCSHWTIEGLYFQGMDSSLPDSMASPVSFSRSGTNIIFRRNVVKHNNQCKNSAIFRIEHVTDSLFEDNEFLDFHRNGVGAGARNLYRRNHIHSRGANSPTCFTGDGSHDRTRGDSGAIVYAGQPNHDMLWENNIAENSESGFVVTGGILHKRNKFYGNIARLTTNAGFHEGTRGSGFKENNYYEHNLSLGHRATGFRCRGSVGVVYRNNSAIAINMGLGLGKPGFSCDVTIDGWGNHNYSWTLMQNLSVGHSGGTGIFIEHPVNNQRSGNVSSWELRKNNSFGDNTNYRPSSGGTAADGNGTSTGIFTGNTTVNPELGDALICIPTTSPMHASQRADGLQIGASILYRYDSPNALQAGNLTRQPLWSTSKGAGSNCPNSASGWYPSWLRPCIAGVNDIPGQSLYDIADRVISRNPATVTSVLRSCVVGGNYP
jgi:hypothetical protein